MSFSSKVKEELSRQLCALNRERQVVELRYFRSLTQDKTAKILQVSQVQISRIERKAMEHLRKILLE